LEVVIGLDRIKIEKEKVQGILDWLVQCKGCAEVFGIGKLL